MAGALDFVECSGRGDEGGERPPAARAASRKTERSGEGRDGVKRRRRTVPAEGKVAGSSHSPSAERRAPASLAEQATEGLAAIARGQAALVRALTRRLGSRADAEDFVQAALLKALTRAGDLRDGAKLVPWFRRILETGLADHARRRAAESRMRSQLARDAAANAQGEDEVRWLSCQCLEVALVTVKKEYADVVRRVDLEVTPLRQAALDLGVRPNTLAVRLHRGRRAVIRALAELCRFCRLHWRLDCACRRPATRRSRPVRTR
jgi:RNA polymerase sigma factor (sigma-70 family)